ncbi:MAG: hypothetical protein V4731_16730 [Pseudomonadota bacterium]
MSDSTQDSTSTEAGFTDARSGEGSRPSTSAGVDNIGAGDTFTPGQRKPEGQTSPLPDEKMRHQHHDEDHNDAHRPAPWGADS